MEMDSYALHFAGEHVMDPLNAAATSVDIVVPCHENMKVSNGFENAPGSVNLRT
jgi:hypothetical protein